MSQGVNEAGELSDVTDTMRYEGHTPGPWLADVERMDGAIKTENGNRIICFCNSKVGDDIAMARANSRLIAAAPDLLAENERMRELLKEIYDWTNYKNTKWAKKVAEALQEDSE